MCRNRAPEKASARQNSLACSSERTSELRYVQKPCTGKEPMEEYEDQSMADNRPKRIPIEHVIERLDALLNREAYEDALRLLQYWEAEARQNGDFSGELSIQSELMGLSRKMNRREVGIQSVQRGLELIEQHHMEELTSVGTIYLNAATTMKAFGDPEGSLVYYRKAEDSYQENLKPDDRQFAGLWNNMGLAYLDLADYGKAEELFSRALKLLAEIGEGKLDRAITWMNLADLYDAWMDDQEQKDEKIGHCLDEAEQIFDDPEIPADGYYAFVARKCAPGFGYYGRFLMKKKLDQKADAIYHSAGTDGSAQ